MGVDPSAQGLLEGMGLDGDSLAPMETDEPTTTDPKAKSKLTPAMATRIKQIKPLLSGQSLNQAQIVCFLCGFIWQCILPGVSRERNAQRPVK